MSLLSFRIGLAATVLGLVGACKTSIAPSDADIAALSPGDFQHLRRVYIDACTGALAPEIATSLRPHLETWLQRLTDAQMAQMTIAAREKRTGSFLLTTATTPVELAFARTQEASDRADQKATSGAAFMLLKALAEQGRGTASAAETPAVTSAPTSSASLLRAEAAVREAEQQCAAVQQRYDLFASAVEQLLELPATEVNLSRLAAKIEEGKLVESSLRSSKDRVELTRAELQRLREQEQPRQ